jgi:hypothetical protein
MDMARGSSTVVECLPHHHTVEGLIPSPAAGMGDRIVKKELFIYLAKEERLFKQMIIDKCGEQDCHSGRAPTLLRQG